MSWWYILGAILPVLILLASGLAYILVPTRLDRRWAPKSELGLVPATENGPAREGGIDIIFVHGLGSNPDTTWQSWQPEASPSGPSTKAANEPDTPVNWIRDLFPDDIPSELKPNVRLFFFNYDSFWYRDSVHTRLKLMAADLLSCIDTGIRSSDKEKSRGLVFVGHSYGGLVIKQALVAASVRLRLGHVVRNTKGILFLGTPHRGSHESKWARWLARALSWLGSNGDLLTQLKYDAPALLDLHRDFVHVVGRDWRIVNFFETRKTRTELLYFFSRSTYCVNEASATFSGRGVINIDIPTDHMRLNKFYHRDANYKKVSSQLIRIVKGAMQTKERLYAVPFKSADTYTARHGLQQAIETAMTIRHENGSVPYAVTISGMGGAGKSQLALNYAERHKNEYNPILWIDATNEDTLRSSFQRCARALNLNPAPEGSDTCTRPYDMASVQTVLDFLRKKTTAGYDDPWLVILDNADDPTWGVDKVLPSGECGSVILTSQDDVWSRHLKGYEYVRVDVLTPPEASNLLLRHLDMDSSTAPERVQALCAAIAEKLGCLVLAVDLAGHHIANEDIIETGLAQYLSDFDRSRDDLLKSTVFRELIPSQKTVWTAWDMTFEKLEKHHGDAQPRLLLTWLAHFHGTVIHYAVFDAIGSGLARILGSPGSWLANDVPAGLKYLFDTLPRDGDGNGDWDSRRCRTALDLLLRYGLLQDTRGVLQSVTMHKLVQWRALQDAKDQAWQLLFLVAMDTIVQVPQYTDLIRILKSVFAGLVPNLRDFLMSMQKIAEVYNYCIGGGLFSILVRRGLYRDADELSKHAMGVLASHQRLDNREEVTSLISFPVRYLREPAWDINERFRTPWDSVPFSGKEFVIAERLAGFYHERGRLDDAETQLRRIIKAVNQSADKSYGWKSIWLLSPMKMLAMVLCDMGQLKEAEGLFARAVEMAEIALGQPTCDSLENMVRLAKIYEKQGRPHDAKAQLLLVEKRFTALDELPGSNYYLATITKLYREFGWLPDVIALCVQLIDTRAAKYGQNDMDTISYRQDLAALYEEQGQLNEAETLWHIVIKSWAEYSEYEYTSVKNAKQRLADNYRMQGRLAEAEAIEREMETK